MRLAANPTGLPTRPSRWSSSGRSVLAEAKTSGLAPWRICAASSSEPPEVNRVSMEVSSSPYCVNAPVSELAASYGASVAKETADPDEAYADWPGDYEPTRLTWPPRSDTR